MVAASTTTLRTTTRTTISTDGFPFVLGLGANLGDPVRTLRWARRQLNAHLGPVEVAPLYRSTPVVRSGAADRAQPDYYNTVVLGRLAVADAPAAAARQLVGLAKQLEALAGRAHRFGRAPAEIDRPRMLDIDLLCLGDHVLDLATDLEGSRRLPAAWAGAITVPHPRLRQRRFVLAPLVDIAPDLRLPPDGLKAADVLAERTRMGWGDQQVQRLTDRSWLDPDTV